MWIQIYIEKVSEFQIKKEIKSIRDYSDFAKVFFCFRTPNFFVHFPDASYRHSVLLLHVNYYLRTTRYCQKSFSHIVCREISKKTFADLETVRYENTASPTITFFSSTRRAATRRFKRQRRSSESSEATSFLMSSVAADKAQSGH